MAIIFCDSFEHRSYATFGSKWYSTGGANQGPCAAGYGRNGNGCSWSSYDIYRPIPAAQRSTRMCMSFAFYTQDLRGGFCFYDRNCSRKSFEVDLALDGSLKYRLGGANTYIGGTDAYVLRQGQWYFIDILVVQNSAGLTNGQLIIQVNGVEVANVTCATSYDEAWDGFGMLAYTTFYIDDFVMQTGAASAVLNDVIVGCILPNAAGDKSEFTPLAGANYTNVDDATASTADYNETATDDLTDLYNFEDITLPAGSSVLAVQPCILVEKTDLNIRGAAIVVKPSGGAEAVADRRDVTQSAIYEMAVYETVPGSASAWDETAVNGAQFGVKSLA